MIIRRTSYKLAVALTALLTFAGSTQAQLPPPFDLSPNSGIQVSGLTTTYLSPTRIVWKEAKGDAQIVNEHFLLQKGIGQADLGSQNFSVFKSDRTNTPSIILDFGR